MSSLGGRRRGRRDSHNTQWRNASFRAYADYMETREFGEALEDLLNLARLEPTAIMCAEAVPWRCHRSLISDAVVAKGIPVYHILDSATQQHQLTSFGRVDDAGRVRYDAAPQSELFNADSPLNTPWFRLRGMLVAMLHGVPQRMREAEADNAPCGGSCQSRQVVITSWEDAIMLWTIAVILLILWVLGFFVVHVGGGLIHLLLVIAVIVIIYRLITGRPVV
jgi:hypothetical protein